VSVANRRRLGIGRLAYLGWYAPRAFLLKCAREGPLNLWLSARGAKAMEEAATRLRPPVQKPDPVPTPVCFLTGKKLWYQTVFCAHSLAAQVDRALRVVIHDDGTLTPDRVEAMRAALPDADYVSAAEADARLHAHLPDSRFPALRARRTVLPLMRKLTDIHAGRTGWRLFLDSDMLFFARPTFLLDWLTAPDRPCHMRDVASFYGYSAGLMEELAGGPIPDRVNTGICGLRSDTIDWDRLEHWCSTTLAREGTHYLQEQALTAMLMGQSSPTAAPERDYVVRPARAEARRPTAVLHHYVADSKPWYFRYGWRHTIEPAGRPA
jgi:hypothetical protein